MTRFRPRPSTNPIHVAKINDALRQRDGETAKANGAAADAFFGIFGLKRHGPNGNERRFQQTVLWPLACKVITDIEYEPRTFSLTTGKYTPDWGCILITDGTSVYIECKQMVPRKRGGYRINHDRNRKDFKVASLTHPDALFVWAKWHPGRGRYLMEGWRAGKRVRRWRGLGEGAKE